MTPAEDISLRIACIADEIMHVINAHAEENDTDSRRRWLLTQLAEVASYAIEVAQSLGSERSHSTQGIW